MGFVKHQNRPYKTIGFPSFFDDEFVRDFFNGTSQTRQVRHKLEEDKTAFTVAVELPGFSKEDLNIELKGNKLLVSSNIQESDKALFGRKSFEKTFILPRSVARKKITAKHENGILMISLPKKDSSIEETTMRIKVD